MELGLVLVTFAMMAGGLGVSATVEARESNYRCVIVMAWLVLPHISRLLNRQQLTPDATLRFCSTLLGTLHVLSTLLLSLLHVPFGPAHRQGCVRQHPGLHQVGPSSAPAGRFSIVFVSQGVDQPSPGGRPPFPQFLASSHIQGHLVHPGSTEALTSPSRLNSGLDSPSLDRSLGFHTSYLGPQRPQDLQRSVGLPLVCGGLQGCTTNGIYGVTGCRTMLGWMVTS
ncbi:hypothetical protein NDU88_004719 [Pleurodeles waltl]|uniref:Uncharacterized protein n=1 Tax=Pleurodeles waltl TaxID=8319 RepID=A0AAV7TAJ0_PLEWA|nr:hypothetical protein NDU88_004719 [Pleurodeles waltl]